MSKFSFSSLRVRLLLLVLVAVIPAFVLIVGTNLERRQHERAEAEREMIVTAGALATQQNRIVEGAQQLLTGLTRVHELRGGDMAACSAFLADVQSQNERYTGLGLANPEGDLLCSGLPLNEPVNISDRLYFQRLLGTREFATGEYQIGRLSGKPSLGFGAPILDERGNIETVVAGAVDLAWFNEAVAEGEFPQGAVLTVADRAGIILARHPDPEAWVGKALPEAPLLRTIRVEGEGSAELDGVDGVRRVYAFAPLDESTEPAAFVSIGVATTDVFAEANRTLTRNLALLGVVAALALAAAWFGGDRFVLRQVKALVGAARRLGGGDLAARSGLRHDGSELGELARTFDRMAERLQEREAESERQQEELARRAEDLARSNTELEQFAYVASHDLQEPLRMVSNYTQLLARRYGDKLDGDAHEFIDYAVGGATRMQLLINDLLAFSRVGTKGKELVPTDCEAALEQALANLKLASEQGGAEVTHDPLPNVTADETQLTALFQNLIGNAIKFRGEEPPRVHVSAERRGAEWVFSVRDNGIGIDPQFNDRIFVIFQRLHGRERYPGTGIGLAICRKIVERHGGRIWVESEPGKGASFYFTLPALVNGRPIAEREPALAAV